MVDARVEKRTRELLCCYFCPFSFQYVFVHFFFLFIALNIVQLKCAFIIYIFQQAIDSLIENERNKKKINTFHEERIMSIILWVWVDEHLNENNRLILLASNET